MRARPGTMLRRGWPAVMWAAGALAVAASAAEAQQERTRRVWPLFWESVDVFTGLLVAGSIAAVAIIYLCVVEIRERRILRRASLNQIESLIGARNWHDLKAFVDVDGSFPSKVLRAALGHAMSKPMATRASVREAAELAASEECAALFRRIEPLNVIGNLGPLVGLAGTVWGMIIAFTTLGEAGGQAGPSDLSLGISKALFHTLLGLCLAIPCLLVYGHYRSVVDRICTRSMSISADLVERIPLKSEVRERTPVG